jgi:hypothetical protein
MASGRDGFTKWLFQRWLHRMASDRDGFTKWPLAEMALQNGRCYQQLDRFRNKILLQSSRWEMILI